MAAEETKTEAAEGENADAPKRKRSMASIGVFGGVMLVEGLAIFFCMKFLGSDPDPTQGMVEAPTTQAWAESRELDVADLRVLHRSEHRTVLYTVRVVVTISSTDEDVMKDVEGFLEKRKGTIEDALSRVIRSADEKHLDEPGLETLRRQFRFELNELIGNETTFENVLIPNFTVVPTGF